MASFSLSVENKASLIRQGGLTTILLLCLYEDLQVVRDAVFALANLADALDLQSDLVREGAIETLAKVGEMDDARVQRDTARAFACLTQSEEVRARA